MNKIYVWIVNWNKIINSYQELEQREDENNKEDNYK